MLSNEQMLQITNCVNNVQLEVNGPQICKSLRLPLALTDLATSDTFLHIPILKCGDKLTFENQTMTNRAMTILMHIPLSTVEVHPFQIVHQKTS